jgi:uncharacterized protein
MVKLSREFQVFAKPVGSSCNLRCSYCYYLEKRDIYQRAASIRMTDEILEKYIIQHIEASTEEVIMFSWHGGEPTLAGLDFYRRVVKLQKKYQPAGYSILNGIQTNGTLLNDDWCRFLSDENFMVGISMDGPGEFHDRYRRTIGEGPSFNEIFKSYGLLQKYGVVSEILCVLNAHNAGYPLLIYDFFKNIGAVYITFLPLVIRQSGSATGVSADSISPVDFGRFMCNVFDEWVRKDIGKIKIQLFEEASRVAFRQEHTLCIFKIDCGGVPVVEYNGDFYSCDHYVNKEHLLGNIREQSLANLLDSHEQKAFGKIKSATLPVFCQRCEVRAMCNGECPKNRFVVSPDGEPGLNYLCPGYKMFFMHSLPFVEAIRISWGKTDKY